MRLKADKIRSTKLTETRLENIDNIIDPDFIRVIDQTKFDTGNDGGCQFASIFSAIENKFGVEISYEEMRSCYFRADKFWEGRTEKVSRAIKYLMTAGFIFSFGKVKAKNYHSIPTKDVTYDLLAHSIEKFDYAGISLSQHSPFFSEVTGDIYPQFKIPSGHAMRLIAPRDKPVCEQIDIVNSWMRSNGKLWGDKGRGHITREKFELLKIVELKFCDFKLIT